MMAAKTNTAPDMYATARALKIRFNELQAGMRSREGKGSVILDEMARGNPVIVTKPFKWSEREYGKGDEFFTDEFMFGRVKTALLDPPLGPRLETRAGIAAGKEWTRLKLILERLDPLVEQARNFRSQAAAARNAQVNAEQAAAMFRDEAEAGEANLATTERKIAEYIAGLNGDVSTALKQVNRD